MMPTFTDWACAAPAMPTTAKAAPNQFIFMPMRVSCVLNVWGGQAEPWAPCVHYRREMVDMSTSGNTKQLQLGANA
jgi:hypothetical protein